ncbi:MAG: phosphatase PAP2 family protein [Luteolibacter sp.]
MYGKLSKDYRALATASDIASTFITMAIVTQAVKRISGRESPFVASLAGGRWRPFPSFTEYQRNTPYYDAFPSGHLATLMATITVLAQNYPEKKWIRPVGYTLMTICMWTMANIDVHWVGDYPLALAIGYLSGKLATSRHLSKQKKTVAAY